MPTRHPIALTLPGGRPRVEPMEFSGSSDARIVGRGNGLYRCCGAARAVVATPRGTGLVRPGRALTPERRARQSRGVEADITHDAEWDSRLPPVEAVISCLASRSGAPRDAREVEYEANCQLLDYAERVGARHFVLLSAICVQKPRLAFQREKLKFEARLHDSPVPGTIIRATAFFRSLVGQFERVRAGKPFLLFGSGHLTACKPISDSDLARFIVTQLDASPSGTVMRPIGGPGPALTPQDQGRMLCKALDKPFRTTSLPPEMFDWLRWLLSPLALISRTDERSAGVSAYREVLCDRIDVVLG